ncbi:MAG: hypothetical protein OHK0029_34040 [Armatimonadaceae bacterium]
MHKPPATGYQASTGAVRTVFNLRGVEPEIGRGRELNVRADIWVCLYKTVAHTDSVAMNSLKYNPAGDVLPGDQGSDILVHFLYS